MTTNDLKKTAQDMGADAVSGAQGLAGTVHDASKKFAGQAKDMAGQTSDKAQDIYERTRDRVQDAASHVPDAASDALDAGQRAYDRGSRHLSRRVVKQPIEALLLAGAIGYLVGWATTRS